MSSIAHADGSASARGSLLGDAPARPTTKPDLLKLARGVEDAMSGIVYRDDAQITTEYLAKWYAEDGRVRTEVSVAVVPQGLDQPLVEFVSV